MQKQMLGVVGMRFTRRLCVVDPASSDTPPFPVLNPLAEYSMMGKVVKSVCERLAVVLSDVRSFGVTETQGPVVDKYWQDTPQQVTVRIRR